jgi:hypothetical protein
MPETYVESNPITKAAESVPAHQRALRRWPKRVLIFVIVLWVAAESLSLGIQHTRLRRILTTQIEAAIGRPVEIGSYHFSFWRGSVIEARSVAVGEDPRFGSEYFLRADSMVVHLRWRSLLRAHAEFDAISLSHPSLNLVRNSSGEWNLAEWLPRPNTQPELRVFTGPMGPPPSAHFKRIEIDSGRINFKVLDEKLPFAFVEVSGVVEPKGSGRWGINLQAVPWRAAVTLQHAGVIQVAGEIGGTSSRLRPAAIDIRWTDASLPDVFRLARDNDFGLRGSLSVWVNATTRTEADGWTLRSRAQLQQIHRWDLALRPDNPSLSVIAEAVWRPSSPYLELKQASIEAPRSNLVASGPIYWNHEPSLRKQSAAPLPDLISSADVDARDVLAWAHAFHSGIANDLVARGFAHIDAALSAWPLHVSHAELSSDGVDLSGPVLAKAAHVGRLQVDFTADRANRNSHGLASLGPVTVSWGQAGHLEGSLRFEHVAGLPTATASTWRVSGSTMQVHDLIAEAGAFGWNMSRGWDVAGPFAFDLRIQQLRGARFADVLQQMSGWMEFGKPGGEADSAVLRVPFLNLPIEQISAHVEVKPGIRRAKLTSAQAFGTRWRGALERRDGSMPWQFDLTADQLSAADLDRWLNPRWRESFFDRMLPFLTSRAQMEVAPENLEAMGHLVVGRFTLARLATSNLQGDVALHGRRITVADADGQFYGGEVSGSFDANLGATPSYRADLDFSHVRASQLISMAPSLAGLVAESAEGQISFSARGATRAELISSLACQGTARATSPELLRLELSTTLARESPEISHTRFAGGDADFSCARGNIEFGHIQLLQGNGPSILGSGTVDFKGNLDFRFRTDPDSPGPMQKPVPDFRLTGTLAAPEASPLLTSVERRAR